MPELNIQQKVINFVTEHPEYQGKPVDTVLSVMLNLGEISQAEINSLKPEEKISAFGFGFNTGNPFDFSFTRVAKNNGKISTTPASSTQRKTSNLIHNRNKEARESFETQLKQLGWAGEVADFFKSFGKNNEEEVRADLETAERQAQQLKSAAEESADAFEAKFKEIYGVDYNAINVELYEQAEITYKEALEARTIENYFNTTFDKLLNQDLADEYKVVGSGNTGAVQTITIPKEEIYEEYFNKFAEILGKDGKDVLNEYIKQAQAEDFALYGFGAGTGTLEYKWNLLQQLAKVYSAQYATATNKACNGSKFEDIQARYEKAYNQAFGTENDILKRVNDYNISQVKGAGYVKAGSLMAIMLASTFIPMLGAGAAGATGAGAGAGAAATAAGKGALLLSMAKSAGTVAAISAGLEITDRFTTRDAREALKKEGLVKYLETANANTDWGQIAKASLSAGAMCVVFGGVSYALTNVTIRTCLAGGMSNLGAAYTAAGVSTAGTIATGLGIEYLATGEITVEGVIFTVTMAVIGGVTQVVNIQKQSAVLQKDAQLALEILGIEDVSDLTVAEARSRAQAILLKMAGVDDMANISAQEAKTIIQNYSSNFPTTTDMNNFNLVLKAYGFFSNNLKDIQFLVSTGKIDLSNTARAQYYYQNPVNSPLMLTAPAENSFTQFGQVKALPQPSETIYNPASAYTVAAGMSSIPIGNITSQTILGQTALSLASANSTLLASNPNFTSPIVDEIVSATPARQVDNSTKNTLTEYEPPKLEIISIISEESLCSSETEQTGIGNNTVDFSAIQKQVREILQDTSCSNSEYRKILDILQEHPEKVDIIINSLKESKKAEATIRYLAEFFSENINNPINEILLEYVSVNSCEFTKEIYTKILQEAKQENVQIALEIVKQTQDQIGRFSLEGFEKLCFMGIVEPQARIDLLNSPCFKEIFNKGYYYVDKQTIIETFFNAEPEKIYTITKHFKKMNNDKTISEKELFNLFNCSIEQIEAIDYLLTDPTFQWYCSEHHSFIKYENFMKLSPESIRKLKDYKIFDIVKDKNIDFKEIYKLSEADLDNIYILNEMKDYSLRPYILFDMTSTQLDCVAKLMKIKYPLEYAGGILQDRQYSDCMSDILNCDEDTLIEITKLACLTKEDGTALIDIRNIRSLLTANAETVLLVTKRFLENPNSRSEDIAKLLNTPLKQLQNPDMTISAEEQFLNQAFQELCRNRHFSSNTEIYKCCSREDGSLDENALRILEDYTEFSYYDDAHIIKIIKAFQTKDGSYDFEKYLRTKSYLEDHEYQVPNYLILATKCTDLETTFPQIASYMESFNSNTKLETYVANNDEELIEMSKILADKDSRPYNFYALLNTINENPEKAYLLLKAYDTLSKSDDISSYLSILTPEYIDDDFKMIDLISELNKFTSPYSIVNIVQDLAPQLASVEFLDSTIEIAQLLNSTYKNAEYTFKFDSIIRNLTPENIPVINMLLQKFNGTISVNDPKRGVIENAVISDSTLKEVSKIREPKELQIIVDMIENDILPIATNYNSNGNLLLIFKDTLKAILKYPEIFEAAKNVKSPYAINLFKGYANFNERFSMILAELNSEQKEGLYKILSCSTDDGWRTRIEFIDNINLELFKKLSPEQYEYLNIILDNCAENDSFYALSKIIGQIYDLASSVRAENAELFIKLLKRNDGKNYKSITKILQGQQTYDKKEFQELLALADQETPALAITTFSEVVSKPYNPELHKYILENIHKEDPDFTMSGIVNYLSATGSDLDMIEYIRNSDEFYAVVLKQQSDFLERTERTCLILFDEILKEIRSTGKTRMNMTTAEILWDKDFDTDLFKKLYSLKDSDGNYIIHGQEMVKLLDNREIALKILNESTESVPKLNLENIEVNEAQAKEFFDGLPNIYKIILANKNGEFGIAEYKEVLKKLNQNQFLRDALAEFEKTGKIDLAKISDQNILQIILTNSTNTLAIAQILPDLVESNPLAVRKIQADVEDIIDFYLEKTRTFFEANPGQIPGNISPEKMIEVLAGAIWQNTKTLKNIIDVLDLVGKERFIQSIDNVDNPYRNEFNLSHFEPILDKEYTPLLKEVFALKDFSSQDIDLIIQISKYTNPHYDSITITSRDFNEILKTIKKQGFLDRKALVAQLYDAILNSNIENFEKMTEQELKIIAEYNLIDCPNVKIQQWKDFANLPEEIRPIIIKLLENNEYQRIKKLLTISDQEIENLHYREKVDLVNIANKISDEDMVILQQSGTNVVDRITKISRMLEIPKMYIPTDLSSQRNFISNILSNRSGFESIISAIDLTSETFKDGIPLKYSRESFISDIKSLMENLPAEEQSNLLKHFGLEDSGSGIEGLPVVNKDFTNLPENLHTTASEIANKIEQFIYENETTIADLKVKESLDAIIKGFPEFTSIIGKVQHGTHAYTVDIHTLKVLQTCIEDPHYAKLSDQDKFVLKFAVLMHDFGKKERTIDQGHQHLSSDYAYGILSKYNLPDSVKYRIMEIVDNHHWFEAYCTGKLNAEQVMATFRDPANFDIAKIFARADFMGVNENFHIGRSNVSTQEEFEEYIKTKFSYVDKKFDFIMSHANFVFDTKFLYNGANFPKEKVIINGIEHEIPVLNLTSPDLGNLEQYGFPKGTKLEDVRFLVHMPNGGDKIYTWMQMYNFWNNIPKNESIQSVSMISMAHKETYYDKGFGFILDVDQANISTADDHNVGSGYAKDVKGLAIRYFEDNKSPLVRNSFLKRSKELGYDITEEDYKLISKFLYTAKHITAIYSEDVHSENKTYIFRPDGKVQISNSGDTSKSDGCVRIKAKDLREILEGSRDRLQGSASHSELVIYRPRVIGLFAKTGDITECPDGFLRFAIENNYPIILVGN